MAQIKRDMLFGTTVIVRWIAPVISDAGTVTSPPRLEAQVNAGAWVTVVTLPGTSVEDARKPCGFDIEIQTDRIFVVTYALADDDTIVQRRSTDRGATWA